MVIGFIASVTLVAVLAIALSSMTRRTHSRSSADGGAYIGGSAGCDGGSADGGCDGGGGGGD